MLKKNVLFVVNPISEKIDKSHLIEAVKSLQRRIILICRFLKRLEMAMCLKYKHCHQYFPERCFVVARGETSRD